MDISTGVIVVWAVIATCVAIVANSKGRNPVWWWLYGFVCWPVALTHILVKDHAQAPKSRREEWGEGWDRQ